MQIKGKVVTKRIAGDRTMHEIKDSEGITHVFYTQKDEFKLGGNLILTIQKDESKATGEQSNS